MSHISLPSEINISLLILSFTEHVTLWKAGESAAAALEADNHAEEQKVQASNQILFQEVSDTNHKVDCTGPCLISAWLRCVYYLNRLPPK